MTLDELYRTLPNGFHDAEIKRTILDYENGTASLTLDVWVGDMEGSPSERELYRLAELTLEGLAFWIIQPRIPIICHCFPDRSVSTFPVLSMFHQRSANFPFPPDLF